ncbi:hypothetical protein G6F70_009203 [Rhizopus microsporus]|uniref:Glutathione S-transferase omega-1 n=2 Tax=Rhizopus TaxID=4842 RepID=A0A367KGX0_RHIAZ|nr:hypothetical protein G6F71_009195 [Rhizopus microsporus]RCI01409.1 hypothetical protein CU097_008368 [Rhizopus azygosporus]KAG1192474.1 hypothetical protein G6F70_009203 [Rhizopus microsporus]KAG1205924.1 hypothetical protein G6F69_009187 [Rhizopus microsporus]KAG1225829.1 hypothetical protein G6F67_009194 [Rhizopus microsporus]
MSSDKITFYNAVICPYAQRAAIALREVGAEYETVEIDLSNKPDWYKDINPELKVPAFTVGGKHIAESLVLVEYLNDRFPEKNLLPKDPLKRAYVRYFIEYYSSKVQSEFFKYAFNIKAENAFTDYEKNVSGALDRVNELLVQQSPTGPYFLGNEYSIADIAVAPLLARILAFHRLFLNGYEWEAVKKYPRLSEFIKGITERPSFKETYIGDEEFVNSFTAKFNITKP